ncbi:uncharacterized protein LOC122251072 [Penaeus japonicus]|uniref:uncharacterized protein LOC122251072 n=1 Tax=Penaeus japonicus TaxID=27405 RepID=UPI001C70B1E1|nr:uncharacterized protein LOC122251072 [Penaeus japonicus]
MKTLAIIALVVIISLQFSKVNSNDDVKYETTSACVDPLCKRPSEDGCYFSDRFYAVNESADYFPDECTRLVCRSLQLQDGSTVTQFEPVDVSSVIGCCLDGEKMHVSGFLRGGSGCTAVVCNNGTWEEMKITDCKLTVVHHAINFAEVLNAFLMDLLQRVVPVVQSLQSQRGAIEKAILKLEPSLVRLDKEGLPHLQSFGRAFSPALVKLVEGYVPLEAGLVRDLIPTYKALQRALNPSTRLLVEVMLPVCKRMASDFFSIASAFRGRLREVGEEFKLLMLEPAMDLIGMLIRLQQQVIAKTGKMNDYMQMLGKGIELVHKVVEVAQPLTKDVINTFEEVVLETKRSISSLVQNGVTVDDLACIFDPLELHWCSGCFSSHSRRRKSTRRQTSPPVPSSNQPPLGSTEESLLGSTEESLLGSTEESLLGSTEESLLGSTEESVTVTTEESITVTTEENLPATTDQSLPEEPQPDSTEQPSPTTIQPTTSPQKKSP